MSGVKRTLPPLDPSCEVISQPKLGSTYTSWELDLDKEEEELLLHIDAEHVTQK